MSIVVYLTLWQRGVLEGTANDNLASQAQLQASTVERTLSNAAANIQALSENSTIESPTASREEKLQEMLEAQQFTAAFEDVTLVDTEGQVIDSTTYLFSGTWSDKTWYEEALAGRASVSDAHLIASPRRLVVVFTAPVIVDGRVSAVIAGQMNMELVWDVLDSVRIGDTGFMMAVDRNGNLISHPDKDLLLTKLAGSLPTEGSATSPVAFTGPDQGLVGRAAPVGVLGWHVVAVQGRAETYAIVNDIARTVAAILVIVLLLTAGAVLFFSRTVGRAERSLRLTQFSVDQSADAMLWITPDGHFVDVNAATCRALGYSREELLSMKVDDIDPDSPALMRAERWDQLKQNRSEVFESRHRTKEGKIFPVEISSNYLKFDGKEYDCAIVRDITERKQAEETITHMAYHDALTQLPNRVLFQDRLSIAMAQARRTGRIVALLFLDLDRFKVANDTVGHASGDRLLQEVARRLTSIVREGDTVARMGGDEFALLSSEISQAEDVADVAERILESLRRPWTLQGQEFHVTASIGIAMYPGDGDDVETLLRNADLAMYRAKDNGKDNFQLYAPAMNARIADRLSLETDLRHGLERKEFTVYYQPQLDIHTGQVVGAEALVRWQHPERGLVLPTEFITLAEENGLIEPLGEWVLRTACAQNQAWQDSGLPPIRVAVNLSARQFQQRGLADTVAQALQEVGLAPHLLQLEITEGVVMMDVEFTIAVLQSLRDMGVQVALDDFGTGHSSLAFLRQLPIDVVKIDRSFVRDITADPNDAAIASTIITLAHNLNLNVIAEGVETEEQLAFLDRQQCDEMQGYLFSKPVPAGEFKKIMSQAKRLSRANITAD